MNLLGLARETVRDPRTTFAQLRALNLPTQVLWEALVLTVAVSVILAEIGNMILLAQMPEPPDGAMFLSPFAFGGIQFAILALTVVLIDRVGRAMGGTGGFGDALLAVAWLQFIMICVQVVQTVLLILVPGLAGLVMIAGLALFLYLMTAFIAELHGFPSLGRVFAMICFVLIGVALGLSFILTLAGVTVPR